LVEVARLTGDDVNAARGATDWTDYKTRVYLIAGMLRTYQQSPLIAPFPYAGTYVVAALCRSLLCPRSKRILTSRTQSDSRVLESRDANKLAVLIFLGGDLMLRYSGLSVFLALGGCKTPDSVSDTSSIGTSADIVAAHKMLGGELRVGQCLMITSLINTPRGDSLSMKFSYQSPSEDAEEQDLMFSNHENVFSRVDVKYGALGFGAPYAIVLERVAAGEAPARKFQLTIAIADQKPTSVQYKILHGYRWNVLKRIECAN
jgi:hypothetical protein